MCAPSLLPQLVPPYLYFVFLNQRRNWLQRRRAGLSQARRDKQQHLQCSCASQARRGASHQGRAVPVRGDLHACEFYTANLVLMGGGKGKDGGSDLDGPGIEIQDCFSDGGRPLGQSHVQLFFDGGLGSYWGANQPCGGWPRGGSSRCCLEARSGGREVADFVWGFGWTLEH
ncbi:uncharacterized protein LOC122027370 [Zingiber officinale]|uniref:uncharacterized protein LOC122027370 n=1 Tax=Zingiber officinale TaxID=94328 RepID=UPI001C4AB728|nr:uncharacterized protein LOC122027370 [Zingiber officinale]